MEKSAVAPHPHLPEYYPEAAGREPFVRELFDDTARWYDPILNLLSFGFDGWYRRQALERMEWKDDLRLLDVATGTGAVARAARAMAPRSRVVGLDPSFGMLLAGRKAAPGLAVRATGEQLPLRDAAFDRLTVGFALRHMADLRTAFDEYRRALRPGGKIMVLEITPPRSRIAFALVRFYMNRVIPFAVRLMSGKRKVALLMHYYWDTIESCVPPDQILEALREAGFINVRRRVEVGIFSEYHADVAP